MDVRTQLRNHLDMLFAGAPRTRAAYELQEELMADSLERLNDLTRQGMSDEDALQNVISGIGNVDELLGALPPEDQMEAYAYEDERRARKAMVTAISVGMYILAGAVFMAGTFLTDALGDWVFAVGMILAILLCIVPTVLLVYNSMRYPTYQKAEETVVEDFKEWSTESKKQKSLRGAVSSLLWTLTVVVYLLISFSTSRWGITWLIFPIAGCIESAIGLLFRVKEMR